MDLSINQPVESSSNNVQRLETRRPNNGDFYSVVMGTSTTN